MTRITVSTRPYVQSSVHYTYVTPDGATHYSSSSDNEMVVRSELLWITRELGGTVVAVADSHGPIQWLDWKGFVSAHTVDAGYLSSNSSYDL